MANPDFERQKEIEDQIRATFEQRNPTRFFTPLKVSDGKQMLQAKFATMPKIPQAVKDALFSEIDKFASQDGIYRIPQWRLDIKMTASQYRQILSDNEMQGFRESAVAALEAATKKILFQSAMQLIGANSYPYYGMLDAGTGNGTFHRPLTAGAATKAGAWTTATYGGSDLSSPIGQILQHAPFNDGTALVLFYPSITEVRMAGLVPDQSGQVVIFKELANRFYGAIEPVGKDSDSTSLLTGAAESATNFEMLACNPRWFNWLYDIPPIIKFWEAPAGDYWYLRLEVHGGIQPIPYVDTDSKIYKAMSYIDTCGS